MRQLASICSPDTCAPSMGYHGLPGHGTWVCFLGAFPCARTASVKASVPPWPVGTNPRQALAASLSFRIGRTLTFTVARFALNTVS